MRLKKKLKTNDIIELVELFMERYEEYRSVQLQRVYTKIGHLVHETMEINKY